MTPTTEPTRGIKGLAVQLGIRPRPKGTSPPTPTAPRRASRRLQRLGHFMQRWRRSRNEHANEYAPGMSSKTASFTSDLEDMPQLQSFPKYYHPSLEDSCEQTQHGEDLDIPFSPQEFFPVDVTPHEIAPQPVILQEAISKEVILQEPTPQQVHPPAKCVYQQMRDIAKQFAQSMMSTCLLQGQAIGGYSGQVPLWRTKANILMAASRLPSYREPSGRFNKRVC